MSPATPSSRRPRALSIASETRSHQPSNSRRDPTWERSAPPNPPGRNTRQPDTGQERCQNHEGYPYRLTPSPTAHPSPSCTIHDQTRRTRQPPCPSPSPNATRSNTSAPTSPWIVQTRESTSPLLSSTGDHLCREGVVYFSRNTTSFRRYANRYPTVNRYQTLIEQPTPAPPAWRQSCTHTESTLHQLSPYIGKLKSKIAQDLISTYTKKGDVIADVFCGSGSVPLEAAKTGRRTFAADASPYALTLTRGKLYAPSTLDAAYAALDRSLLTASTYNIDLNMVPKWVRNFYHPDTLRELLSLIEILTKRRNYFLLACLLGISHHQRPGFLSYPSSHLVPYLRTKKFPPKEYPELYEYRSVAPRLKAKITRALQRYQCIDSKLIVSTRRSTVQRLTPPSHVNCFITSPPYMNALDYGRDNRLRNWLLSKDIQQKLDTTLSGVHQFRRMIASYATLVSRTLTKGGHCIFVVGEKTKRDDARYPSAVLSSVVDKCAPTLILREIICDQIPDVRRCRRNLMGVKKEHILIYEKRR